MSKKMTLVPLILSLVLVSVNAYGVHRFDEENEKILSLRSIQYWKQQNEASSCLSHKPRQEKGSTMLEMKHLEFCPGKTGDWDKKLQKALALDDLHVRSLQSRIRNKITGTTQEASVSDTQIPLISGVKLQTLNYIVTVELGGKNMTLIVDTGSDLTWVQCQPCSSCYNQQDSMYDPSVSPSYQTVFCNSSTCQSLLEVTGYSGVCGSNNNQPTCNYAVSYGDGSYTRGDLGSERIRLGGTKVENFVFGCGRNNKGLFGGASGLLGLGKSSVSLVSQTYNLFNGVFSYCLPSLETGASGTLSFGNDSSVYRNSTPLSYTPLKQNPQLSSLYILNLTRISIGGSALQHPRFGSSILIDSGTIITRLPPSIYKALKTEFLKQFSWFPSAPGYSILDTCFDLSGYDEVSVPTIKMSFEGNATLEVDVSGTFYFVKTDASLVCLALASLSYEDEIGIIANYQQINQRVIYDTKDQKLGFARETCSFS